MFFLKIFLLLNLISTSCLAFVDLSKINFKYKYDPEAEVQYSYKVAVAGNTATVFLKFSYNENKVENPNAFNILYELYKNYKESYNQPADTITLDQRIFTDDTHIHYYKIEVPVVKNETLVVVKLINRQKNFEYVFDVPVDLPLEFPKTSLLVMEKDRDIPYFQDFLSPQDSFRIVSVNNEANRAFYYFYSKQFAAADPPMSFRPVAGDKEMNIDSIATISTNTTINLREKGLYFFQQDTSSLNGFSLLIKDEYYPQFVRAETLIEPLIYISTAREIKKVKDSDNKKKALDIFWLDLTKSPERAKKIIRDYYRQIELVNLTFSTYKEGWKTDQGMIMALFGSPDAVFNDGDIEEWIYERRGTMSRIKFNFTKVKNIFTNNHYELVRNPSYDREWYRTVDQWRKGRQEI